MVHLNKLKTFLVEATQYGYANPDKAQTIKEKDGSTTITYSNNDWKIHDNFFGGEPYGGREVVFYKEKPVFIMVYYGWVNSNVKDIDAVYSFLQSVLKKPPIDHPYRGPKRVQEKNLIYKNKWTGDIESFTGEETISENKKNIYFAKYMGGLVDQRKSNEI